VSYLKDTVNNKGVDYKMPADPRCPSPLVCSGFEVVRWAEKSTFAFASAMPVA
jgi:hypothetical protein